ncbi:uncharacterized protein LOC141842071 [Curcuma longa]|uniref:uncharacterized protein LOC141842071 n=1 Tax=Curcuma longa TaxID=136217 RepID=UPI003D9EA5C6
MMDDFSFPTVAVDEDPLAPFPHFASPPFCFLRSLPTSAGDQQLLKDAEAMKKINPKVDSAPSSRRFVDEERMDMLWEDFNDETARKLSNKAGFDSAGNSSSSSRCLIHRRRPSLIVMVKVLKKLMLLQKAAAAAASSKRKQHHSTN